MSPIYALSIHADYRCRHSGACCTSQWPIPVERATAQRLRECISSGQLTIARDDADRALAEGVDLPHEMPVLAGIRADGSCAFYERDTGLCAIHGQVGEALLPVACRQFPRVSLVDQRGLFVNLSHYCPTAADLLFREDDGALRIVEGPPAFPPGFPYDALDARSALPPLLTPGVLLDHAAFGLWETKVVELFGNESRTAEECLAEVTAFTEAVCAWTPQRGQIAEHVRVVSQRPSRRVAQGVSPATLREHTRLVFDTIPDPLRPALPEDSTLDAFLRWVAPGWDAFSTPVRRYLAAQAFASWLAYQGRGLRTIVSSLEVALSLLKVHAAQECDGAGRALDRALVAAAVRRTDETLVHLASREALARRLILIAEPRRTPLRRSHRAV